MNSRIGPVGGLTADQVAAALTAAIAAPSLHNSQPWRFHCTPTAIDLYADTGREIPVADPDRRELLLACGAALLNLRLSIRASGVHPTVSLLPDHQRPELLARVRATGRRPVSPADHTLMEAIHRRHTNRKPFLAVDVPLPAVSSMRIAAKTEQAWLAIMAPTQLPPLRTLVRTAHQAQLDDPLFKAEWAAWTGRLGDSTDGVPIGNSGPLPEPQDPWVLRDFSAGNARTRLAGKDFEADPVIGVVGSLHDLPLAWLQAGQAMQRILLTATAAGLAASFLSQVVEVPVTRQQLRELIGGGLWPQAVLRIGYGTTVPAAPRRDLHDVVEFDDALADAQR